MKKQFFSSIIILSAFLMSSCGPPQPPPEDPKAVIVINEVYSQGGNLALDGTNYGDYDWVELYNNSDVEGDVSGFMLYDKLDKVKFIRLPEGTKIAPRGFLLVEVGVDEGFGLSKDGDEVYLEDAKGKVIDHVVFGPLTADQAYARNPDGSNTFGVQKPTPGATNNNETPIPIIDYTGLVINEVDGNGKFVELYNNSANPIPLANVKLIKDESQTWWNGGEDITIEAGGFYTIAQTGTSFVTNASEYTGYSGISPKKIVQFELKSPYGILIDVFARKVDGLNFGDDCTPDYAQDGYSFSRCPNGTGEFGLAAPSCNSTNPSTAVGPILTINTSGSAYIGLVINEVNGVAKWFELYNMSSASMNLEGVKVYYNNSEPANYKLTWTAASTHIIPAGGYLVVLGTEQAQGLSANNANVRLQLRAPNGDVIDTYEKLTDINTGYSAIKNKSHARVPDGTGEWYYTTDGVGTSGATNGTSTAGYVKFGNEESAKD